MESTWKAAHTSPRRGVRKTRRNALIWPSTIRPLNAAAAADATGWAHCGSMLGLTVHTFAPNVYLLVLLALLDRLVLSPMITQRLGAKAARCDDR
jgi:hypothetical protein